MQSQQYQQQKNSNHLPIQSQLAQMHQSYQLYSSDLVDVQTAQFIKTNTLIQNNNNNNINANNTNNNINANAAVSHLANSQLSSQNQQKKSSNIKKNSTSNKEPMTISINHMIMQNQSICQGFNEESMEKSQISQGGVSQINGQLKINERLYFQKKKEKSRFKEILRSRNILFLAVIIFIFQADTIYIFSQNITDLELNYSSKIFFYILIVFQTITAILFILLGCKKEDYYQYVLKQKQIYLGIFLILLQISYYESVCIALRINKKQIGESSSGIEDSYQLIPFRLLNIFILNQSYSLLIKSHSIKSGVLSAQLIYFALRFFFIRLNHNYIEFLVILSTFYGLYLLSNLVKEHSNYKKNLLLSTKFQRILNNNNNPNINSNYVNNIGANYLIGNGQPSNKGSPPEKNGEEGQDILNKQSFTNNNISLQGIQISYPYILNLQSQQSHTYQKQQSLGQNINSYNSYNKTDAQNAMNTNNNQIISYNSLNGSFVNLEKPLGQLDNTQLSSNPFINKKSQFGLHQSQQSSQYLISDQNINTNTQNNNQAIHQGIQNLIKSEKQHQMSKISELDLENEFSKHNNNNSNHNQNILQNGFSIMEQKSLIDQLIEVDGVVVFEQETQYVVFANQNILALLETDTHRILQDVMSLKQVQFSMDEKTPKEAEFSYSNMLKHIFKDVSLNPSINSPILVSQNNTSKASNKIGSNPLLNRVIEEENEQDQSPQTTLLKVELQLKQQGIKEIQNEFNFSDKTIEELSKPNADRKSVSMLNPTTQQTITKPLGQRKSILQNNSLNIPRQKNHILTKSRSHNYKPNPPYLTPASDLYPEDEDEIQKGRMQRNESIFKKLSPQYNSSSESTPQNPLFNLDNQSQLQNNNDGQSFLQNRQQRESLDFQFPSFISSISHIPRKNTMNQGSFNTFERERNNTLKDIMDDVRSKSGTFLAQHRKSTITVIRKKTLNTKKQLNYSQQPETVINNMVLFKENTTKIYLMKYSIVEHAGKILHIISIRDLSNEVFEQILERQNTVLIDELYKYLNFTEISQILAKSLKQMKDLKYKIQAPDYKQTISPIKLNLKLFKYLMNDIFDVRSLQYRNFLLNKDYFDLQQELLQAKKMTESLWNDIVFNFYYDKLIPIQILNDKDRIAQILMNLLVNCCKLVKNKKIFLKAKMCKEQSLVKIIIQNRELNKSQKDQILKAFVNQTNSLGYHFFISNLLAKQVSNQKYKLEIISNKQEYVKFKFYIYLFTNNNSSEVSQIQLIKPSLSTNPQQGKSQNTISEEKKSESSKSKKYMNSLSHLDLDENECDIIGENNEICIQDNDKNKVNESPPTHLDKGLINITSNLIKDSKSSSNDNKQRSYSMENNQANNYKKTINLPQETPFIQHQDYKNSVRSLKTNSNEGTELSEQIENNKIKDFHNINEGYPMKFISDLE